MVTNDKKFLEPLTFKKLDPAAQYPTSHDVCDAGYDLHALRAGVVPAHGKLLVKTGIAVIIPFGYYGRIAPRSSVAWKHHIDVGAGVIDCNYRGDVGIVLLIIAIEIMNLMLASV